MKKSFLLLFVMSLTTLSASAYDFEVDGIYYNIINATNKTVEVTYKDTNYNSYSGDVRILSYVDYNGSSYKVSTISAWAFARCTNLTSVTIPEHVQTISPYAFYSCTNLEVVTLPQWVTQIGANAFAQCSKLKKVISLSSTPPTISNSNAFIYSNTTLYVANQSLNAYRNAAYWSSFSSIQDYDSSNMGQFSMPNKTVGPGETFYLPVAFNCVLPASYLSFRVDVPEGLEVLGVYKTARVKDGFLSNHSTSACVVFIDEYSGYYSLIDAGEGDIVRIRVKASATANGNYNVALTQGSYHLGGTDQDFLHPADASATITVGGSPEAYACYTSSNSTLTFYYDNLRSSRPGTTYDLPTGDYTYPDWHEKWLFTDHIVFDPSFADARPSTTRMWFSEINPMSITGLNYLNTSEVTDMSWMFQFCHHLTSIDLSNFNTANVNNMQGMFYGCDGLTSLDMSSFNTANVTDMSQMFIGCNVTNFDMSSFNTGSVQNMSYMFNGCDATTLDLSHFNTANVTDMSSMFSGLSVESLDLSGWNTSNVTSMYEMFNSCSLRSLDLSSFNTKNVTDMSYMFSNCTYLTNLDLSNFNTSHVESMFNMFYSCLDLRTLNLSSFNTENVTTMYGMFQDCTSLTSLDLSSFNTFKVYDMSWMFSRCSSLSSIYVGETWATEQVTNSNGMFSDCTNLIGGMGTTYDANHTDKAYAHIDGGSSNPGYLSMPGQVHVSLEEALNVDGGDIEFYNDADCPWFVMQIDGQKDGRIYAQSGNAGIRNSVSTLIAEVTAGRNGAILSFDFKAWGEGTNYDVCIFEIDGTEQFRYGALQNDWETYTVQLTPGYHELSWSYQKDGSVDPEGDYFAIDNVKVSSGLSGDVDGNGVIGMDDLTALINYLVYGTTSGINMTGADIDGNGVVGMDDLTALINYLVYGHF